MAISILIATKIDAMLYRPRSNSPVNCVMANFSSVLRSPRSAIPNKSQNKSRRLPPMLKGSNCKSKLVLHDLHWLVPVSNWPFIEKKLPIALFRLSNRSKPRRFLVHQLSYLGCVKPDLTFKIYTLSLMKNLFYSKTFEIEFRAAWYR